MSNLTITRVNVDAVNREGLQAKYLQLALCGRLLHEVKLLVSGLQISGAAVTSSFVRRGSAAVGMQPVTAAVSGVGNTEKISAAPIWWPRGGENNRDKDECVEDEARLKFHGLRVNVMHLKMT